MFTLKSASSFFCLFAYQAIFYLLFFCLHFHVFDFCFFFLFTRFSSLQNFNVHFVYFRYHDTKIRKEKNKNCKNTKKGLRVCGVYKRNEKKQDIFLNKSSKGALLTDGYTLRYKRKAGGGSDINTTNVFVCLKAFFFSSYKKEWQK